MDPPVLIQSLKTSSSTASIELQWRPPMDIGGVPIVGYKLYMTHVQTGTSSVAYNGASDATITDYLVPGLVLNDQYSFWVTSLNPLESAPSSSITLTAAGLPSIPGAITQVVGTTSQNSLSLQWPAVTLDGGSPIISYTLVQVFLDSDGVLE